MKARQILEAITPKQALRDLSKRQICPGRGYWLNIVKVDEPWEEGEFCPAEISAGNRLTTPDGLYGLSGDVENALNLDPNYHRNSSEGEDRFTHEMDAYETPIWAAVGRGITSGTVNGIDGPKKWQLVFQSYPGGKAYATQFVDPKPVQPGVRYPVEPLPESDNPKRALRYIDRKVSLGEVLIYCLLNNGQAFKVVVPITWSKHGSLAMANLDRAKPSWTIGNLVSEEDWAFLMEVVEYGLNERCDTGDHPYLGDEHTGEDGIFIDEMRWQVVGSDIETLENEASKHLLHWH